MRKASIFTHVEEVVVAVSGYFHVTGLVYGFMQQQAPRLDWLYYLVAGSTVIGVLSLGAVFTFRPPNRRVLVISG